MAIKIWFIPNFLIGLFYIIWSLFEGGGGYSFLGLLIMIAGAIVSLPVLVALFIIIPIIINRSSSPKTAISRLLITCFICTIPYGLIGGASRIIDYCKDPFANYVLDTTTISLGLFLASIVAILCIDRKDTIFSFRTSSSKNNNYMDTSQEFVQSSETSNSLSNKIMIKGIITGSLILILLIPMVFISNLVDERQQRRQEVEQEISSKWASPQTFTGPYLYIPYTVKTKDAKGVETTEVKQLLLLPENMYLSGKIIPEIRERSIYKVLLYKSDLKNTGNFIIQIPTDIDTNSLQLQNAKICAGVSDYKGIEEKLSITFNGISYDLSPGLPTNDIDSMGLSSNINLLPSDIGKSVSFSMLLKLKGSGQLHFVPLSGNSTFTLQSPWNSPSFDGNALPGDRTVTDTGFTARWTFNKANLPFGTVLKDVNFKKEAFEFGIAMLQPADEYAKTSRCIKYAILFIGLTLSLFFIIELTQKKPLHPVQYAMVGIALTIFFSLLLSISEFILFSYAYLIAAFATILLVTLYAKSHFQSWKTGWIFAGVLTCLYGFIYILVSLEDTALLIGSIGLFAVLALIMYASRKINWYGTPKENIPSVTL